MPTFASLNFATGKRQKKVAKRKDTITAAYIAIVFWHFTN